MSKVSLIAFDLDNTLLDSDRKISPENLSVVRDALAQGIHMVPATGRLYAYTPRELRELCRYFIVSNGAAIYDSQNEEYFGSSVIPCDLALEILRHGDTLPCIYDSFIHNTGYMSESMCDQIDAYAPVPGYAALVRLKNTLVPDLKDYISSNRFDVQKIQYYFQDLAERDRQLLLFAGKYPGVLYASTSLHGNMEINAADATKGKALGRLCDYLSVPISETIAIGDGTNDLSMIRDAGIGICMRNGAPECLAAADLITRKDCDHSGFADALRPLLNYQKMR